MRKIVTDLKAINYKGRISFSGYGEPLLHKNFIDIVKICRDVLSENIVETNTNGDFLTIEKIQELFRAGLTFLYINLYDSADQREPLYKLMSDAGIEKDRFRLRDHWPGSAESFGLVLNNRSGMVQMAGMDSVEKSEGKRCFYPFYKMLIDWDGRVLFCSNDWGRQIVVGNVTTQPIQDIWLSKEMKTVRDRLARGDRSQSPCNTCNVDGTLHG